MMNKNKLNKGKLTVKQIKQEVSYHGDKKKKKEIF
jgi:hypothetical protein